MTIKMFIDTVIPLNYSLKRYPKMWEKPFPTLFIMLKNYKKLMVNNKDITVHLSAELLH